MNCFSQVHENSLKASASRGIMSIFCSILKRTARNDLTNQDDLGLTLMHYAAIYDHPSIIHLLFNKRIELNIKQLINGLSFGPMPLHYAVRCSSLDTASFLLNNYANSSFADNYGWMPIHHAAYVDNVPGIKLILRRNCKAIELLTRGENKYTPLLLAANGGSLQSIKCLIELGANLMAQDSNERNLIQIAVHRYIFMII